LTEVNVVTIHITKPAHTTIVTIVQRNIPPVNNTPERQKIIITDNKTHNTRLKRIITIKNYPSTAATINVTTRFKQSGMVL